MAKTYRPYVPEQDLLLPPSLRDWLPEDHLAYFVSDLIDQLDLSAITTVYEDEERGYPPYHPVMLTNVLVYAYCVGVFSSRKIQRRLREDVAFRVLAAGNEPEDGPSAAGRAHRNPSISMRLLPTRSIVEYNSVRWSGDKAAPYHAIFPSLTIVVLTPVPCSTKSIDVCSGD
jgi:Transposase domain (DUF772)